MKTLQITFLILIAFLLLQDAKAHTLGGELQVKHLSGNSYKVELLIYKEVYFGNCPANATIYFVNQTNSALSFNTQTITNFTDQNMYNVCASQDPSTNYFLAPQIRKFTFPNIVLPPGLWTISATEPCRKITTFQNSPGNISVIATINNLDIPNASTSIFKHKPQFIILNKDTNYISHEVINTNDDSLYYSFYHPLEGVTTGIDYSSVYTYKNFMPLSCNHLDSTNGLHTIAALPTSYSPISSNYGIKVERWVLNTSGVYKLASTTYRDLILETRNESNHYPILSGMDTSLSTTYSPNLGLHYLQTRLGDTLSFNIHSYDADIVSFLTDPALSKVSIKWDKQLANSSLTKYNNGTDSAYVRINYIPDSASLSPSLHVFSLQVSDSTCPYPYVNQVEYSIQVLPAIEPPNSIYNSTLKNTFTISPNPSHGELRITSSTTIQEPIKISVLDISGKLITSKEIIKLNRSEIIKLDLSNYPAGIYLLRVETTDMITTKKCILN